MLAGNHIIDPTTFDIFSLEPLAVQHLNFEYLVEFTQDPSKHCPDYHMCCTYQPNLSDMSLELNSIVFNITINPSAKF